MTDKHLINSVENCVRECLYGFSKLHPHFFVDFTRGIVFDPDACDGKRVALISGGGSGHEPFPAGYVGEGMLTASVSGEVFTSPPSRHILHAVRLVAARSSSVLLLVPNYTGDVLNFGLAAENAVGEGVSVESVIVGDDVAQEVGGRCGKAGKRGMCGLVLVIKVAGFLSERGEELATVKKWSLETVRSVASMGLCVTACSKPGVGALFHLGGEEVEVGVGVHGEAGVGRTKMMSGREAVEKLLEFIVPSLKVVEGDEVVALVNNLGSLSYIEQWLLAGEVEAQLSRRRIKVVRLYAGRFFTSLNMAGVQICVMRLSEDTKETILSALDHPTRASAWKDAAGHPPAASNSVSVALLQPQRTNTPKGPHLSPRGTRLLANCFTEIARDFLREEHRLNDLDSVCGDGDCGSTFSRMGALMEASGQHWNFSEPCALFSELCSLVEESVGGTTGALYGLFFKGISRELGRHETANGSACAKCWRAGVEAIKKYSSARLGDRTMLDSLELGCRAFERHFQEQPRNVRGAFGKAVGAAVEGCQQTKGMRAVAGRASYTDSAHQKDVDAGAYAVTVWLLAIQRALDEDQNERND